MAIKESAGFLMYKDGIDTNLFFPITTVDNVDGMDEIEESLNQTVRFTEQTLTEEQKAQARSNIGITPDLFESSGGSAIANITAVVGQTIVVKEVDSNGKPTKWEAVDLPNIDDVVSTNTQELTDEQKSQVRENIGAMSSDYMPAIGEDDNNKLLMVQNGQWVATPLNVFTNNLVVDGVNAIEPNIYYDFGRVDSMDITLVEADDTIMNEYCFEFTPSERFTTLKITPQPRWAMPIQIVPGKVHQASILRGIGVMVCA